MDKSSSDVLEPRLRLDEAGSFVGVLGALAAVAALRMRKGRSVKYVVRTGEWPAEDAEFGEHQDVFDTLDEAAFYASRQRQAGNLADVHELRGYMMLGHGARVPQVGQKIDI